MTAGGPADPDTPLLAAVLAAARDSGRRLQTPTHQGQPSWASSWPDWARADVTENEATDDLGHPQGPVLLARRALARHYEARASWFSVGGATLAQQAALWATAAWLRSEGRPPALLVDRNAHVSVLRGMAAAGLEPYWFEGEWDAPWGVRRPPSSEDLARALARHPDVSAVHVTSPTYFGEDAGLSVMRRVGGDRLLLVDEAHGAHRPAALKAGADLVVHSAHKGLSGPTQGGFLHLGKAAPISEKLVDRSVRQLQTTSPSWPLLAALDACRAAAASGPPVPPLEHAAWHVPVRDTLDPVRLLVAFPSGIEAYESLRREGFWPEAALPRAVLLLLGPTWFEPEVRSALQTVLEAELRRQTGWPAARSPAPPPLGERVLGLREASLAVGFTVASDLAVGRTALEPVCPYPPGVAVIVPGCRVTREALEFLQAHDALPETLEVLP